MREPPASGRLQPREVLGYLYQVAELSAAGRDAPDVDSLMKGAVPRLADEAVLFVIAGDGRLHRAASAAREATAPSSSEPAVRSDEGLYELAPIARDSTHPAMVAARTGALAYIENGDGMPGVYTGEAPVAEDSAGAHFRAVAVPVVREGEPVGALYLCLEGDQLFGSPDLEPLATIGRAVSLALENARLRREAREARRAKADFLAVVSHELRTPLTAVVGYADLLEAGIPGTVNEGQMGYLARIKESAWELLELIDGILGFARYEGEEPELSVEVVRPEALVDDAVLAHRNLMGEKGLELRTDAAAGLPAFRTDREKATRILFHLLSNAGKFTESGEVRVSVRSDAERVFFTVEDTGPGIPTDDMGRIFEPFWQGQRPDTRTAGGAGMGLSLAKRLTELLSGELTVRSREGQGTTVRLALPREGPHPTFP